MKDLQGTYHPVCRPKEANKPDFHVKVRHVSRATLGLLCTGTVIKEKQVLMIPVPVQVIGEVKQSLYEGTNRKTLVSQCCYIHLKPPLVINNLLPVKMVFSVHNKIIGTAEKGHSVQVTEIEVGTKEDFQLNFKVNLDPSFHYRACMYICSMYSLYVYVVCRYI
jgi:hypothetical protein